MILLINYFTPPNLQRYSEYITCIHENLGNKLIKQIIVFVSDNSEFNFTHKKLKVIQVKGRPTYKDYFDYCNKHLKDEVCILANTDIFFDESLEVLNKAILWNVFVVC